MGYIILGVAAIFTLTGFLLIFSKLTPDNTPDNLAGYFNWIFKFTLASIITFYVVSFLALYVLG